MTGKQRRARASEAGIEPFEYLLASFKRERNKDAKRKLAMELLPYLRPKLKSVELRAEQQVEVTVIIGGDE